MISIIRIIPRIIVIVYSQSIVNNEIICIITSAMPLYIRNMIFHAGIEAQYQNRT